MAEQDQDRTEQATPFKLKEARKKGQVPKSLEVNSWFVLVSFLLVIFVWGKDMVRDTAGIGRAVFAQAGHVNFIPSELVLWFGKIFSLLVYMLAPIMVVLAVVAVLMNFFQTGPIFSFHPIKPDVQKLNPVTGFKRVFSKRTLYETAKNLIKLLLFGVAVYFFILNLLHDLMGFPNIDPDAYPFLVLGQVENLIMQLVALFLLIVLVDLIYSRRDFSNRMKMSRREVKDEVKRREGDPQVRAKIKELQREASRRAQSLTRVSDADVLITNPTHKSIAIKYDRATMQAPRLIAKGAGDLALKMRQIAKDNHIPIVENKPLARALFKKIPLDQDIPADFYAEMARILVAVYRSREQRNAV